ncbi:MAG: triacylglycerol lipase [Actinomycetota bacterium]|jgi:pimeloyl-ACP methyl ester carboxylesterase|nr:triacylglycerol lipase [Actinomycetota bacterium]
MVRVDAIERARDMVGSIAAGHARDIVRITALEHARDLIRITALGTTDVLSGAAKALLSPAGVAGAAVELAWASTHFALYPLGLFGGPDTNEGPGYSLAQLPPMQRGLVIGDVEAAGTPILLVHGMIDNRSIFTLLRRGLRRRGFGRVISVNYSPLTTDVRVAAAWLAEEVESLVAETGYERVHVIGHSLGGLIARYYVTRLGGNVRVHTLVTLGTPHGGTFNAYALPSHLCRQLRPGSALMRELNAPVRDCKTRFVAYWSDLDLMVFPQRNAMMTHADLTIQNIEIHASGHMSLPINGAVVHGISTTLAQLDADGSLLTAGVTQLQSAKRKPPRQQN